MVDNQQRPSVGRIVHYVSHGTPVRDDGTQAFTKECRAAIVVDLQPAMGGGLLSGGEIQEYEAQECALVVFNPTGVFIHDAAQDEDGHAGGTWHWPERT
jgi:hypothetical protein